VSHPGPRTAARLDRLEATIPAQAGQGGAGQRLRIVMAADSEPANPGPACGQPVHVVRFRVREDGPQ
jgi:hypothetical protein